MRLNRLFIKPALESGKNLTAGKTARLKKPKGVLMKTNKLWLGILVIILVFGMAVVGCDNDPGDVDTWSNVTSFSQVNGTWKAPSTYTGNAQGIKVTANTSNYRITFNAAAKTMSVSGTVTTTYSGGNINSFWPGMKESLEYMNQMDGITASANDANHSITTTYNNFSQTLDDDELAGAGFKINQDRTKLKMSQGGIEIIYTKQ